MYTQKKHLNFHLGAETNNCPRKAIALRSLYYVFNSTVNNHNRRKYIHIVLGQLLLTVAYMNVLI